MSVIEWNRFLAQKHIDSVLDIKEDEVTESILDDDPKMVKSKTMSSIHETTKKDQQQDSAWGSFNGSFFDNNPTPSSPITNAPPRKSDTSSGMQFKTGSRHLIYDLSF